ncbi:hypothetical protein KAW80_03785 [Candidatus Babeliales bacterium]|nr:hypothetical protein [Candidatus Babeliales bacterium]
MRKVFKIFGFLILAVVGYKGLLLLFRGEDKAIKLSEIKFEKIYSTDLERRIKTFVLGSKEPKELKNPKLFYKELKTLFKVIKEIKWDYMGLTGLNLTIVGVEPEWLVNKELVLGDKKRLLSIDEFSSFDSTKLKNLTLSNDYYDEKIKPSVYQFLQKVPREFSSRYTINYINKREIFLYAKNGGKNYSILADEESIFDNKKLQSVDPIHMVGEIFDVRFRDRIIVKSRVKNKGL